MSQIKNRNQKLANKGDYAFIEIKCADTGATHVIFAMNYDGGNVSLYSKDRLFEGLDYGLLESAIEDFPYLRNYRYGWVIAASKTLAYIVRNMCDGNSVGSYRLLGVITDDLHMEEDCLDLSCHLLTLDAEVPMAADSEYISDRYTKNNLYNGLHGYHDHHYGHTNNESKRGTSKYLVGIELEVEFSDEDTREDFTEKDSNWFFCESDGSLGENGCEIITIPLNPQDATDVEFWNPLTESIKDYAYSWSTGRCGLHVHVSRTILGSTTDLQTENLGKLLYLYHHHLKDTRVNVAIYGRSRGYNEHDGKTKYGDAVATIGKEILKTKKIKDKLSDEMREQSRTDRYFDINILNEKTIEFRKGRGSINSHRIVSVIEWCTLMCEYVKITPWQQIDYQDFISWVKIAAKGEKLRNFILTNA